MRNSQHGSRIMGHMFRLDWYTHLKWQHTHGKLHRQYWKLKWHVAVKHWEVQPTCYRVNNAYHKKNKSNGYTINTPPSFYWQFLVGCCCIFWNDFHWCFIDRVAKSLREMVSNVRPSGANYKRGRGTDDKGDKLTSTSTPSCAELTVHSGFLMILFCVSPYRMIRNKQRPS